MTIDLPAFIGETVFADFRENGKKKLTYMELTESYIKSIEFNLYDPEPLFTVFNKENTDYRVYWKSEFGRKVFTKEDYFKLK